MAKIFRQNLLAVALLFLITYAAQVVTHKSFVPRFSVLYLVYSVMGLVWLLDDLCTSDKNDKN